MDAAASPKPGHRPDLGVRETEESGPHPFAEYIRTIGRGPTLSRALSRDEAAAAMGMVLHREVAPAQLGALLVLLRYRKETPDELAGFVDASRAAMTRPAYGHAALDWPSYADRHKQLPYFVLAAKLLAENGTRVLMHGIPGEGPVTTPKTLAAIGVAPSTDPDDAARRLDREYFAYLPLETCCPPLMTLFAQRPILGVRSAANTFGRMLNPFAARHQLQGVFHPAYLPTHKKTAALLGQPFFAAFKGGGGEIQRNPEKPCRVVTLSNGEGGADDWPALITNGRHPWRNEPLNPPRIAALWRGEDRSPAPTAAVVGTVAVALRLLGEADVMHDAEARAQAMWAARRTTLP
ncbi:MAG: glycosyl transferase family protein [Alphaproteobacteria bacterium]|nr:glycosyl transferase family protein [Alphaproteobacteria bacterium]